METDILKLGSKNHLIKIGVVVANLRFKTIVMRFSAIFIVAVLGVAGGFVLPPGLAKAYIASRKEMIERASAIALVDIKAVDKGSVQGKTWLYSEVAPAKVIEIYKGKLESSITIYGGENFICARNHWTKGLCIVFLDRDGKLYTGANWHLSCLPVTKNASGTLMVNWLNGPDSRDLTPTPLSKAKEEIAMDLSAAKKLESLPAYLKTLLNAQVFADGIKGESVKISDEYKAYEQALRTAKQDKPQLELVLVYGTPPGRLYAALVLSSINKELGRQSLAKLQDSKEPLVCASGCEYMNETLGPISATFLKQGKFLNFKVPSVSGR